MAFSDKLC